MPEAVCQSVHQTNDGRGHACRLVLCSPQLANFERLCALLDDLILDTPHAQRIITEFIQRAITDGMIAPRPTWT